MKYDSTWYKIWDKITNVVAKIHWCPFRAMFNGGKYWSLTEQDHEFLRKELKQNYYVILTARSCHLSTYLIRILSMIKGDDGAYYAHALMNMEDDVQDDQDYRIIEATGVGVHYSTFMEAFDVDAVALLKPKNISIEDWNAAFDSAKADIGKPYDDVFDLSDKSHVSCVELVLNALQKIDNYEAKFPSLVKMVKEVGNLTPQMFRTCEDFEVHWEVKR